MKRLLLLLGLVFSGCFDPSLDGATCGPNGECPAGLTCNDQNKCTSGGGPGPTPDAPPGAPDGDQPNPADAMPSDPDATPPGPCELVECVSPATCEIQGDVGVCVCPSGWRSDGANGCDEIDECAEGTAGCNANATCSNSPPGSFTCACNPGYVGDGFICTDADECAKMTAACDVNAFCTNVAGSYTCMCNTGYSGDGFTCTNIDECASGTDMCEPTLGVCTDVPGSYSCSCIPGYTGDGFTCSDIDECADGTAACDPAAICTNISGSYTCSCPSGYAGDGFTCTDIDECATPGACGANATCVNTPGDYDCSCLTPPFLYGDGFSCDMLRGHVVLIGHDMFERNLGVDTVVGNAVLLANTPGDIQVLGYNQYADNTPGGEVANTNAAITARLAAVGRTATITTFNDYTMLNANLVGKHVLVVYEKEGGGDSVAIGNAWANRLQSFVAEGGVVIVLDFFTNGWQILSTAGLLNVTGTSSGVTGQVMNIITPTDPIATDLAPYTASNGSISFPPATEGTVVVAAPGGNPVVLHKKWPCAYLASDATYVTCLQNDVTVPPCDDIRTTGTAACNFDDCVTPFTLPFTWMQYGAAHTAIAIGSNGKIQMGPGTTAYFNSCTLEDNTIAAYWDDLYPPGVPPGGTAGSVRYSVLGVAPARRFVVNWNVPHIGSGPSYPLQDIRAVMYEGSNNVDFCYVNTTSSPTIYSSGDDATIGIRGVGATEQVVASCSQPIVPNNSMVRVIRK